MAERDKLKEITARSRRLEDYEKYKLKRNEASTKLKSCEKDYYNNKFNNENISSKTVWKTAFEVLGNSRSSFPSQILHGGRLLSNPTLIATEVNKYFIDKIAKLKETFENNDAGDDSFSQLRDYLSKKEIPDEGFKLKEQEDDEMKKLLKL